MTYLRVPGFFIALPLQRMSNLMSTTALIGSDKGGAMAKLQSVMRNDLLPSRHYHGENAETMKLSEDLAKASDGIPISQDARRGVRRITALRLLPLNAHDELPKVPMVLEYHGRYYKYDGWNSDNGDVFYVEDVRVARRVKTCRQCGKEILTKKL